MDNGYDTLSKALDRIVALEAQLAEARKDGDRLDALERLAEENSIGGLLIHSKSNRETTRTQCSPANLMHALPCEHR